jgi:hypothetical protein
MEFTLASLLTFAATTGIFTALLNQGLGWLRDWRSSSEKRAANAGYLALRIAVLLEAYADACSGVVEDIDNHDSSGGHIGAQTKELPQIPDYPTDDDSWRVLAPDLLDGCLSFPNKVAASQKIVGSVFEWGDNQDMAQQCMKECIDRGLEAWTLAAELRKRYHFEPHSGIYDYADYLRRMDVKLAGVRKAVGLIARNIGGTVEPKAP